MADVEWSKDAIDHLDQIVAYIEIFDPVAADRVAGRIIAVADSLSDFPERGRPAGNGMREMVTVRPYVIRYRVADDCVWIVSVRHAARLPQDD